MFVFGDIPHIICICTLSRAHVCGGARGVITAKPRAMVDAPPAHIVCCRASASSGKGEHNKWRRGHKVRFYYYLNKNKKKIGVTFYKAALWNLLTVVGFCRLYEVVKLPAYILSLPTNKSRKKKGRGIWC